MEGFVAVVDPDLGNVYPLREQGLGSVVQQGFVATVAQARPEHGQTPVGASRSPAAQGDFPPSRSCQGQRRFFFHVCLQGRKYAAAQDRGAVGPAGFEPATKRL